MSAGDAKQGAVYGFSWGFLDEISWWALGIGVVIAVAGSAWTGTAAFAVGCLLGVGTDVALVRFASARASRELEAGRIDNVATTLMVAGRLLIKVTLLVVSLLVPTVMSFAGTVAGVLTFDVTLAFVGGALAVSRTMRRPKEGR